MLTESHGEYCFAAVAEQLLNKGWVPVPCRGKEPSVAWKEFQRRQPSHLEVLAWARAFPSANTAVVMGPITKLVAFDFDADDGSEAMRLYDIAEEILGPSPVVRVGRFPRTLRLYQTQRMERQPRSIGAVEVLAQGRLAVLFGTHPITFQPYRHIGVSSPFDLHPRDLPSVTTAQIERFRREIQGSNTAASGPGRHTPKHSSIPIGRLGITFAEARRGAKEGLRHRAMLCVASACRGRGIAEDEAVLMVLEAAARCRPPYPRAEAIDVVRWCYAHFIAGLRKPTDPQPLDVLSIAHARAKEKFSGRPSRYELLLEIARDIQRLLGDEPVALPQLRLAALLQCEQPQVSKLIRRGVNEGLLIVADDYFQPEAVAKKYRAVRT